MKYENLETFLTIVETRSLTKTADKLYLAQSTITHRLQALESELELKLIQRFKGERNISLTLEGDEFIEIAKRWIALYKETQQWTKKEIKPRINIASSDSLSTCVFPEFYKSLVDYDFPMIIKIQTHWSTLIYELVEDYKADLGLVLFPSSNSSIVTEPLFSERLVVMSLGDSEYSSTIHPSELDSENELIFYNGPEYKIWHDFYWTPAKRNSNKVDTAALLFSIFNSPSQWAIVPISIAKKFQTLRDVKISELLESPPERTCYKIKHKYPRQRSLQAIEVFEGELKKFLESDTMHSILI